MNSASLTSQDRAVIAKCLAAAVEGPFFPDWEFETLIGASRAEVLRGATADPPTMAHIAISVINNLLGYPHGREDTLEALTGSSRAELELLLRRLSAQREVD